MIKQVCWMYFIGQFIHIKQRDLIIKIILCFVALYSWNNVNV